MDNTQHNVIGITAYSNYISWGVRKSDGDVISGSDTLKSANGDYAALMNNVLNHTIDLVGPGTVEYIYNRG